MTKHISRLERILLKAGLSKGIHRTGFDPDNLNKIANKDTLTETREAIHQEIRRLIPEKKPFVPNQNMKDAMYDTGYDRAVADMEKNIEGAE